MIPAETYKNHYTGNGVATEFEYDFPLTNKNYIRVVLADGAGVETELTVDTDFTVEGVLSDDDSTWKIVYPTVISGNPPMPAPYTLTLVPNYPITQEISFENQGGFYPQTHTRAFDKVTLIMQQIQEQLDRCIKLPVSSTQSGDTILAGINASVAAAAASASAAGAAETAAESAQSAAEAAAVDAASSAALVQPYDNNQTSTASTSSTSAYVVTLTPPVASYALWDHFQAKIPFTNPGSATIDFGAGAKTIKVNGSALTGGEMVANSIGEFIYDGTDMCLLNPTVASYTPPAVPYFYDSSISGAHTSSGNWQDVTTWGTASHNDFGALSSGTSVQIATAGRYIVACTLAWQGGGTIDVGARIVQNSTVTFTNRHTITPAGADVIVNVAGVLDVAANDTVKIQGFQANSGNINYRDGSCFWSIVKIG